MNSFRSQFSVDNKVSQQNEMHHSGDGDICLVVADGNAGYRLFGNAVQMDCISPTLCRLRVSGAPQIAV